MVDGTSPLWEMRSEPWDPAGVSVIDSTSLAPGFPSGWARIRK